jgi:hypothetical protein
MPVLERLHKYPELADDVRDMHDCLNEAITVRGATNTRFLGYFYRVGFYGSPFNDLNGAEFIYKEPNVTPLSAISLRLQTLFGKRFGADRVSIIKDSNKVRVALITRAMNALTRVCAEQVTHTHTHTHTHTYT